MGVYGTQGALATVYMIYVTCGYPTLYLMYVFLYAAGERSISYKNILQEYMQKSRVAELPRYSTERTDDAFISTVVVRIAPEKTQKFKGTPHSNKRAAEQESAKVACFELKLVT